MGQFLRDLRVTNVTIDEATLHRLNQVFLARAAVHNASVPEGEPHDHRRVVCFYVIRFDDKGYRFVNFADVVRCFREAGIVQRVIYTMDTGQSRASQLLFGTYFDLRLDAMDANNCSLTVTADNQDWVEATFIAITDVLAGQRSISKYVRTPWTGLAVQLLGVAIGFLLSLWAAVKIAPLLAIDNAFVITFFFALLIYSNIWGYVNAQLTKLIDFSFSNVRFKRPGRDMVHAATQYVVGGLVIVLLAYLLDKLFTLVGFALRSLFK